MVSLLGVFCIVCVVVFIVAKSFFFVPAELRHLPRVPILPLLWSYLSGEEENKRLRKLILPFANAKKEEVVLVWALGRWMVHILDQKVLISFYVNRSVLILLLPSLQVGSAVFADLNKFPKEDPPDDLLLWQLIGRSNILLSNGDQWRKHSRLIRTAINQTIPVSQFVSLARRLISVIGDRQYISRFDDLSQRFALDAVGTTAFGYDFDAIAHESEFALTYNGIMHGIANPLYLVLPALERILPRRKLKKRMEQLSENFQSILTEKRENPGPDMLTFMLRDVNMTDRELRDNMLLLFIAGHVSGSFVPYVAD